MWATCGVRKDVPTIDVAAARAHLLIGMDGSTVVGHLCEDGPDSVVNLSTL